MKMVQAIIRPERFDRVKKALENKGIIPLTSLEIRGRGEQKGIALEFRGSFIQVDDLPKVEIDLVVESRDVDTVVDTICRAARTGKHGDGKIFVIPMERMARVRTDEEWA
ncbi:MAG: P-II family nitrogen regulator [Methanomicrobiales archaeon]|nr:P-II family nitrogen regulator [Methanomicrobiales archaeon]